MFPALGRGLAQALWAATFVLLGSAMLAQVGVIAGLWRVKFNRIAPIANFIVAPVAFLPGAFYTLADMPPGFRAVSHANPAFHLIDGFCFGAPGVGDGSPWTDAALGVGGERGAAAVSAGGGPQGLTAQLTRRPAQFTSVSPSCRAQGGFFHRPASRRPP